MNDPGNAGPADWRRTPTRGRGLNRHCRTDPVGLELPRLRDVIRSCVGPALRLRQFTGRRYHSDTIVLMAMTLRLSDAEQSALRERAAAEGISMQEAARRAVRDYLARQAHQERVEAAAVVITEAHAEALERLGQ